MPLRHWGAPVELGDELVEALAAADHERWRQERAGAGWRHGQARDDAARTNPLLVDWEALPGEVREQNRRAVGALP